MRGRLLLFWLLLFAPAWAHAAEGGRGWHEASSKHFVVYGEGRAEDVRALADKLERFDQILRTRQGLADPDVGASNRLTVFQVRNARTVSRLVGNNSVAGFYAGRASGSYAFVPRRFGDGQNEFNADIILFHEYAHHYMLSNWAGAYPAWFSEGYAEFHSTARFEKDGTLSLGRPAYHRGYSLALGGWLPLEAMLAGNHPKLTDAQRESLYSRGWLLMHYLSFERSRAGQLKAYLAAMNAGKSGLEAARSAFGDLKALDRDLDKYMSRSRISYLQISVKDLPKPDVRVRALSPAEAAIMDVRIQSKSGVDEKEAREVVARARKVAMAHPDDPLVNVTLAEAEYDVGQYDKAEAAADRVLARDPRHVEALVYKGRARMAQAAAAGGNADAIKAARAAFVAANKADPEDPEPLMLFYMSYAAQNAKPTANAVKGLHYALALAPQDTSLRMMAARQHLVDGQAAEAKQVLAPVAYSPHGGELATFATQVITAINQNGAAAALAMADAKARENPNTSSDAE